MPHEMLVKLPSYDPDVAAQQAEARRIMESLGYGPANRLKVKVSTRDFSTYRDPAVILVDQLNKVHFDAELEVIESSIWHSRLTKKDYTVALNTSGVGIDDPDAVLKGAYACNSEANYTQYCTPEMDKLLDRAVAGGRYRQAQGDRLGDRARAGRGGGPPDHLPQPLLDLLARPPQGPRAPREQHLQ